jgi:hypothetical protein
MPGGSFFDEILSEKLGREEQEIDLRGSSKWLSFSPFFGRSYDGPWRMESSSNEMRKLVERCKPLALPSDVTAASSSPWGLFFDTGFPPTPYLGTVPFLILESFDPQRGNFEDLSGRGSLTWYPTNWSLQVPIFFRWKVKRHPSA